MPGCFWIGCFRDLCITQPPSQNTLPGGNTGLRLPAARQAHSPSQYTGSYGYCSNFAKISPSNIWARPRPFVLKWRYAEVPWLENRPYVQELTSENLAQA